VGHGLRSYPQAAWCPPHLDSRILTLRYTPKTPEKVRMSETAPAEEAHYWQSFERLRRHPTEENAKTARRAFLCLAKRHHPDQGGSHAGFLRVKDAYDRALDAWRRSAA